MRKEEWHLARQPESVKETLTGVVTTRSERIRNHQTGFKKHFFFKEASKNNSAYDLGSTNCARIVTIMLIFGFKKKFTIMLKIHHYYALLCSHKVS